MTDTYEVPDAYMLPVAEEILRKPAVTDGIWNINFPGCALADCRGILWDRKPAQHPFYLDRYFRKDCGDGEFVLTPAGYPTQSGEPGSDVEALLGNYISVGVIRSTVVLGTPYPV